MMSRMQKLLALARMLKEKAGAEGKSDLIFTQPECPLEEACFYKI